MRKDEREMSDGYSGHYPNRGYNIMPYYSYDDMDGRSYQRRDSMGRYSRDDRMYDDRGFSRGSKAEHIQLMMDEATDPEERELYRKLLDKAKR